jgi:hypothetical protein
MQEVQPGYVHIYDPLLNSQNFNYDVFTNDYNLDSDFIPDLLTDEGTFTSQYNLYCEVT